MNKRCTDHLGYESQVCEACLLAENAAVMDHATRAMLLAWGGVCPPDWAIDASNIDRMAETIRERGDELQTENARLRAENADLRARVAEVVAKLPPPSKLRLLADWLDMKYPDHSPEVQNDLRAWASHIEDARAATDAAGLCYPFSTSTCDRPECSCRRDKADAAGALG